MRRKPSRYHANDILKARSLAFHPSGHLLAVGSSGVARTDPGETQKEGTNGRTSRPGDHPDQGGVLSLYWLDPQIFGGGSGGGGGGNGGDDDNTGTPAAKAGVSSESVKLLWQEKVAAQALSVMRFSPDGQLLAVGGHDNAVRIFEVTTPTESDSSSAVVVDPALADSGLRARVVVEKHSSVVTHLDWSAAPVELNSGDADGSEQTEQGYNLSTLVGSGRLSVALARRRRGRVWVLQSTSASYELLYFDELGRVVTQTQRDTPWASWSCTLGA
jgi:WD40 repeat protein